MGPRRDGPMCGPCAAAGKSMTALWQRSPLLVERRFLWSFCNSIQVLGYLRRTWLFSSPAFFLLIISIVMAAPAARAANGALAAPGYAYGENALAQATSAAPPAAGPALHRRAESQALAERNSETLSSGRTTLPADVSGQYLLGENGESIEIDLEPDRLSGYVSRFGDQASDEGEPLTFFFASTALNGRRLSFLTRQIHGEWLSFSGTIVRGEARSRAQQGYYRLEGRLVRHDSLRGTAESREVSLPLAREFLAPSS